MITCVDQPSAFVGFQEAHNRRIDFAKWLHLAPGLISRSAAFVKRMV
jgi:hypothetical protein